MPVGTTVRHRQGPRDLVAAANNSGKTQRAWFYEGVFKLAQTKGAKPLTTLKLTGKLSCGSVGERERRREEEEEAPPLG